METPRVTRVLLLTVITLLLTSCEVFDKHHFLEDSDRIGIYSAIMKRAFWEENDESIGDPHFRDVYLLGVTEEPSWEEATSPVVLSENIRIGISEVLASLPSQPIWIESQEEVYDPDIWGVVNGGMIIRVGNIHPQRDGSVHIAGGHYVSVIGAKTQIYVLERHDGSWTIVGKLGLLWIS